MGQYCITYRKWNKKQRQGVKEQSIYTENEQSFILRLQISSSETAVSDSKMSDT